MALVKLINIFFNKNKKKQLSPVVGELVELTDTGRMLKIAYLTVGLGSAVFILWASFVPLDEGVPVMGTVAISTKAKILQHPQGGVVNKILVKEGDYVNKDDLLIKLQDLAATANYEHEKNRLLRLEILNKELAATKPLVREGFIPMVREYELKKEISDLNSTIDRIKSAQDELRRTEIRSPVAGQVVGLSVQTIGGVIQPGQKIMEIVPGNEELIIEVKIPPHLVDRVKVGDFVDVRFSTFSNSPQLVVAGVINSISTDILVEPNSNSANLMSNGTYYLARISITSDGLKELGGREMQSGMPVAAVIKTGSRTLMQYIMHPLTKRIAFSMKEQ